MQHLIARPSDRLHKTRSQRLRHSRNTGRSRTSSWRYQITSRFVWQWAFAMGLVGSLLAMVFWADRLWLDDKLAKIQEVFLLSTARAGFIVTEIQFAGNHHLTDQSLQATLSVNPGTPMAAVDIDAARRRIEGLEWVRASELRRVLPDQLRLRIVEREPIALWQRNKDFIVVDALGEPIEDVAIERFGHLPLIVGEGAPGAFKDLWDFFGFETNFTHQIEAATWVARRRWNLRLANGLEIFLPEGKFGVAWDHLSEAVDMEKLLSMDLLSVDLRKTGQIVVEVHPEAVWESTTIRDENRKDPPPVSEGALDYDGKNENLVSQGNDA